ncbi:MAG: hypothetical protein ACJ79W_22775, partial [Myxococcales bacterium]
MAGGELLSGGTAISRDCSRQDHGARHTLREIDMRIAAFALCALLAFSALPKEREGVTAPP